MSRRQPRPAASATLSRRTGKIPVFFEAAHDEVIAASFAMHATLEAKDKQKKMDVQQLQTEPIVGMKRAYDEVEDTQSDIYDVYPPNKKRRVNNKAVDDSSDDHEHPVLTDNSVADPNLVVTYSDNESVDESDIAYYRKRDSLPSPRWFVPLSLERRDVRNGYESHDDQVLYLFDYQTSITEERYIAIPRPCQWMISRTIPHTGS